RNAAAVTASASFLLLLLVLCLSLRTRHGGTFFFGSGAGARERGSCEAELQALEGRAARCRYLRSSSHPPCAPTGYVDYLALFYCACGEQEGLWWSPWLGGAAIALWLLLLFYLLGDTASEYFCASLEGLSAALRLPPAVAGVTLGALGGALFVSTVVAGVVAIVAARRGGAVIERRGFVRDVCFLLVALCYLLAVLVAGTVTVWAAACFLSLYAAYVLLVSTSHCCSVAADDGSTYTSTKPSDDLAAPLLLPVAVSSKQPPRTFASGLLAAVHAPLYLPRRLTIPDIAAHRWSRPCAITSTLLGPLLLAVVTSPTSPTVLLAGALTGTLFSPSPRPRPRTPRHHHTAGTCDSCGSPAGSSCPSSGPTSWPGSSWPSSCPPASSWACPRACSGSPCSRGATPSATWLRTSQWRRRTAHRAPRRPWRGATPGRRSTRWWAWGCRWHWRRGRGTRRRTRSRWMRRRT
uniref:Sodium/calcium exchanger membrane region domain-containing protein n=1 Tax=Aegilops tauschii subsp. strangulata TaxID=200361 RepID=A0A453JJG1_AEGTS